MEAMVKDGFAWVDRRVFVTGATGLLGAWVTKELQSVGALVVTLVRDHVPQAFLWNAADRDRLVCVPGALEDFQTVTRALNEYEIDTVIHLGAQTIVQTANRGPLSTFEANIRGTYNLLEACRLNEGIRAVLVASSDKAYGEQAQLPYTEDMPLLGRHPYDVSKACADMLALAYGNSYSLPVCVTRCGNLYGPGDLNWNRIVPGTIRSVLRGEQPLIRSDGSYVRDYFYVRDAAMACIGLAKRMHESGMHAEAFNFSTETRSTVLEVVEKILILMGSTLRPRILASAEREIRHQYLSAAKARSLLGWTPSYSLDDGLRETIAWYSNVLDGPAHARSAK